MNFTQVDPQTTDMMNCLVSGVALAGNQPKMGAFSNHKIFGHMLLERTERSELAALAAEIM